VGSAGDNGDMESRSGINVVKTMLPAALKIQSRGKVFHVPKKLSSSI
jgi:hypothetical protein